MSRKSKHGKVIIYGTRKGLASFYTFFITVEKARNINLYKLWFQRCGFVAQINLS